MAFEWAKPGARCVCVDDYFISGQTELVKGKIYTIEAIMNKPDVIHNRFAKCGFAVRIKEVKNPHTPISNCFSVGRFRPLITQQDDVELFRHLLSPSPLERLDLLADHLNITYKDDA